MTLQEEVNKYLEKQKKIKLHLGCGSNILNDYINVDGEYCASQTNIVIHNLTEFYPLADDTVDEILSVHVIEHIMPNLVEYMFKEWLRILKPGGCAIVEWPDLLKMCKYLVDDPSRIYSDNKKVQKRGIAGIFGFISKYQDITMLHKWGYSEESMRKLFLDCGFTRTEIQTVQYQKTEMDSRVVAYK